MRTLIIALTLILFSFRADAAADTSQGGRHPIEISAGVSNAFFCKTDIAPRIYKPSVVGPLKISQARSLAFQAAFRISRRYNTTIGVSPTFWKYKEPGKSREGHITSIFSYASVNYFVSRNSEALYVGLTGGITTLAEGATNAWPIPLNKGLAYNVHAGCRLSIIPKALWIFAEVAYSENRMRAERLNGNPIVYTMQNYKIQSMPVFVGIGFRP